MSWLYPVAWEGGGGTQVIDKINAFSISNKWFRKLHDVQPYYKPPIDIAKDLFDYFANKDNFRYQRNGIRCAHEALEKGRGNCGTLSLAFIDAMRIRGIESYFVHVTKNDKSEEVNHACASVHPKDADPFFVDVAYNSFDIVHDEYEIKKDDSFAKNMYYKCKEVAKMEGIKNAAMIGGAAVILGLLSYNIQGNNAMSEETKNWLEHSENTVRVYEMIKKGQYRKARGVLESGLMDYVRQGAEHKGEYLSENRLFNWSRKKNMRDLESQIYRIQKSLD